MEELGEMDRRGLFEKIWDIAAGYGGERLFGSKRDRIWVSRVV